MSLSVHLYHRLPPSARSAVASLRGAYLRQWRYGRDTDRLTAAALEREHWPAARWKAWQEERLAFVLHRAATRVPYYRDQWQKRRQQGDRRSWEVLEHWPILEKPPLREHPEAFVADDCDRRRMFHEHTSGTTGTSLDLWWSRDTVRRWYALYEARCRRWNGASRHDRWAILGGQLVVPVAQKHPPFWVRNVALHQLYMSSYHLAPELLGSYLDALMKFQPRYALGYSSSLYELAVAALKSGRRDLQFDFVLTNAEPLFDYQRQAIERAFGGPVRETYGMAEAVAAATECAHGRLHEWPEVGLVEIREGDRAVANGEAGDLICTGLLNADMPLIRYRVGDRGRRPANEAPCPCGRHLPALAAIDGRADDTLYTAEGRRIGRLDPVFKTRFPIVEAQIVQETLQQLRVRYVPAPDYSADAGRRLVAELQARCGRMDVVLEPVSSIPRTSGGKFRAVVCEVPPQELARVRQSAAASP